VFNPRASASRAAQTLVGATLAGVLADLLDASPDHALLVEIADEARALDIDMFTTTLHARMGDGASKSQVRALAAALQTFTARLGRLVRRSLDDDAPRSLGLRLSARIKPRRRIGRHQARAIRQRRPAAGARRRVGGADIGLAARRRAFGLSGHRRQPRSGAPLSRFSASCFHQQRFGFARNLIGVPTRRYRRLVLRG
jgi:hypothetical protein